MMGFGSPEAPIRRWLRICERCSRPPEGGRWPDVRVDGPDSHGYRPATSSRAWQAHASAAEADGHAEPKLPLEALR